TARPTCLARRNVASGCCNGGRHHGHGTGHERSGGDRATRRVPVSHAELFASVHQRRHPGHRADHVHPGHAGTGCDMGSALTIGVTPEPLVQMSLPALQESPVFAPPPESSSTELIMAPGVALVK